MGFFKERVRRQELMMYAGRRNGVGGRHVEIVPVSQNLENRRSDT
jgi:hypothetical protein